MNFFDIILGILLVTSMFKGIKNGVFIEFSSLVSLILGIYVALKFSFLARIILPRFVDWNPKTIQLTAFIITLLFIVLGISLLAKFLTSVANFSQLGVVNKIGGGFFCLLKTILIISIFLNLFEKINFNNTFAKKAALDNSLFYHPVQQTAGFIYPSIEKWYDDLNK